MTLDNKGRLRIHYVKEKIEKMVEPGEVFRSGKFGIFERSI